MGEHRDDPDETTRVGRESESTPSAETSPSAGASRVPGLAGRTVGRYRLVRELGHGAQGYVYLAEDERLRRMVAVKLLPGAVSFSAKARVRFEREAEVASRLDHPGICTIYEVGEDDDVPYIAMQLIEGVALDVKLRDARAAAIDHQAVTHVALDSAAEASTEDEADSSPGVAAAVPRDRAELHGICRFIESAARTLHAAHEAGLVHRDMKPGNLMVDRDGRAVILDFGLARDETIEGPDLTQTGDLMGTPAYMSPEQLLAHRIKIDRRTDVYSLGVTLYECLTLRRPFEASSRQALYEAISQKSPPSCRSLNPAIPRDLEIVVETAMERERDRRYQTALDLAEELRRVRNFEPIVARPAGPMLRLRRWAQRNPALATAVFATFIALSSLAGVLIVKNRELDATNHQLERESALKDEALDKERAALVEKRRLVDRGLLAWLTQQANDVLWPAVPSQVPGMKAWLETARDVASRLDEHRGTLGELSRAAGRGAGGRERIEREALLELVAGIERLQGAGPGPTIEDMESRLDFASKLEGRSIAAERRAWDACIAAVASDARFGDFEPSPQMGLVPLGIDEESGLWEFWHVPTGERPVWVGTKLGDGRVLASTRSGIVLVLVPGGTFLMGAQAGSRAEPNHDDWSLNTNEGPVHEVSLVPFFMSKFEMTQAQWERVMGENPSWYTAERFKKGEVLPTPRNPVENVSWIAAGVALKRCGLVLPTESQWESAARAGEGYQRWTFGNDKSELSDWGNVADRSGHSGWSRDLSLDDRHFFHAQVGSFAPNAWGLHDVVGNVAEWCRDGWGFYNHPKRGGDGLRLAASDDYERWRICEGDRS